MIPKIIAPFNQKNIKLTFFAAPVSNFLLTSRSNYDEYVEFIKDFGDNKNVSYAEFNLIKDNIFPYKQTYYSDSNLLSENRAAAFSMLLSHWIKGNITENDFSISIEEKLLSLQPYYNGIRYTDNEKTKYAAIIKFPVRKIFLSIKLNWEMIMEKPPFCRIFTEMMLFRFPWIKTGKNQILIYNIQGKRKRNQWYKG